MVVDCAADNVDGDAAALDDFGACARATEAARQGVTAEELAEHGVMYYLADLDSARLTRKAPPLRRS